MIKALVIDDDVIVVRDMRYIPKSAQNRIVLRSQNYLKVINFDNILYCEGESSYTHFYLLDKRKITVSHSIVKYEELLPEAWFIRTRQSYLVNNHYMDGFIEVAI